MCVIPRWPFTAGNVSEHLVCGKRPTMHGAVMLVLAGHTEPDTHLDDPLNLIMQAAEGLLGIQLLRSASQPLASAAIDR
jgi:hypothetical protein